MEKNINLAMALACKSELERHGIVVRMSRLIDEEDSVTQEVKECNSFNPDIAIDCHNNAGGGDGFEAFYWPGSNDGLRLAKCIENEVKAIGQNSRGLKSGKGLYFVKNTKCTAVLLEGFFVDNVQDRTLADTIPKQQEFGRAYARGILDYFGIVHMPPTKDSNALYRVQVGAFKDKTNADKLAKKLRDSGFDARIN